MNYILRSDIARLEAGELRIDGYSEDGSAILVREVVHGAAGGSGSEDRLGEGLTQRRKLRQRTAEIFYPRQILPVSEVPLMLSRTFCASLLRIKPDATVLSTSSPAPARPRTR